MGLFNKNKGLQNNEVTAVTVSNANTKVETQEKKETTFTLDNNLKALETISNNMPTNLEDAKIVGFFKTNFNKIKLNEQIRKELANELSVEDNKAMKWETVSDVFSCLDITNLADLYPAEAAKIVRTIVNVLGIFIPACTKISSVLENQPDEKVANFIKVAGFVTPSHIIHSISNKFKKKSDEVDKIVNEKINMIEGEKK